jgi:hypothetical protein
MLIRNFLIERGVYASSIGREPLTVGTHIAKSAAH